MKKIKHYYHHGKNSGETQKRDFSRTHFYDFLAEETFDEEGLEIEKALWLVNHWNSLYHEGHTYWIDSEKL